jgi:hypothetical protein
LELLGESVDILDGEGEGGNKGENGLNVERGSPKLVMFDQRQTLEDRHLIEHGQVSGQGLLYLDINGLLVVLDGHLLLFGLLLQGFGDSTRC